MSDGIKGSLIGGIIGIIIIIAWALAVIQYLNRFKEIKIEWIVGLSVPLVLALMGWFFKFSDILKKKEMDRIFGEIALKADKKETDLKIVSIEKSIEEYKINDKVNYDRLFEYMTNIDSKLDKIVIELIKKK